jgi:hypothetical protein
MHRSRWFYNTRIDGGAFFEADKMKPKKKLVCSNRVK